MRWIREAFSRVPRLWNSGEISRENLHRHANWSAALDGNHEFDVYLPPGYDEETSRQYPVLYLLHGYGDDVGSWTRSGRVHAIAGDLIERGQAVETIVVMPCCYGDPNIVKCGNYALCSDEDRQRNCEMFTERLLSRTAPQIEKVYRVLANRESRAIAGVSMGGAQALAIGISHPDYFGWVGAFGATEVAGGLDEYLRRGLDSSMKPLRTWLACGGRDVLLAANRNLHTQLEENGYNSSLHVTPVSGHNWDAWRLNLREFLPLLFRSQSGECPDRCSTS